MDKGLRESEYKSYRRIFEGAEYHGNLQVVANNQNFRDRLKQKQNKAGSDFVPYSV